MTSIFERKPGTDICDSCGTDLARHPMTPEDDLIKRLRGWFATNQHPDRANEIMQEAADALASLRADYGQMLDKNNECAALVVRLQEANERLKIENRSLQAKVDLYEDAIAAIIGDRGK